MAGTGTRLAPMVPVEPPPMRRAKHGLFTVATLATDGDRWEGGITWEGNVCPAPGVYVADNTSPSYTVAPNATGEIDYEPFLVRIEESREALGFGATNYVQRVTDYMELSTERMVEYELWTGSTRTANQHLTQAGGTTLYSGAAISPQRALAALEGALDTLGIIHATPELVSLWAAQWLDEDGDQLRTKAGGHYVVSGTGYNGTGPTGDPNATPGSAKTWAFATGLMTYRLGEIDVVPETFEHAFDRSTNTITFAAQRFAALSFNSCMGPYAVYVDLTL